MTLLYDELRNAVAERRVEQRTDASGRPSIALLVRFAQALEPPILSAVEREGRHAALLRSPDLVAPTGVEVSPSQITLTFDPPDPGAIRLDTLTCALAWSGSPLGSPLSAYVVTEAARILQDVHAVVAPDGTACVHRELHAGTLLITSEGRIALVGAGLPALNAVMLPRLRSEADRYRLLGPEAARGEPLDPRADIYSLGVLYYQLLAGRPYRQGFGAGTICQVAIEGRAPDLPADLPDPRPGLLQTLACALAPQRDQRYPNAHDFGEAVRAELASASIALPSPQVLRRMVDEFVPRGAERGAHALLAVEHDAGAFEALMSGAADTQSAVPEARTPRIRVPTNTPTTRSPPADKLLALSEPSSDLSPAGASDPWSSVLGEQVEETSPAPQPTLPLPGPEPSSGSTLPLPDASGSSAPARPLSSERLTALTSAGPTSASGARPISNPDEGLKKSLPGTIAIAVGALTLAGLAAFGVKALTSGEAPPEEPDRVAVSIDAGIVSNHPTLARSVDAGQPAEKPKPVGLLSVLSKPSGATVELDGGYIGETPLVLRHRFEDRTYVLRILADGYEPWEKRVRPDPKLQSISVMAVMEKK